MTNRKLATLFRQIPVACGCQGSRLPLRSARSWPAL